MIEVLNAVQRFELVDGGIKFIYTQVLFRQDGITFYARSPNRHVGREVDVGRLENIMPIPPEAYCPLLPSSYTIAPDRPRSTCTKRKPALLREVQHKPVFRLNDDGWHFDSQCHWSQIPISEVHPISQPLKRGLDLGHASIVNGEDLGVSLTACD
ncbi:hypothetical protein K469DRAFT_266795 [Zopfia rhizophila CBS 207.26]|uniref:Uncharacterized protein n=1 Tax=Zopfia rhizophila CBS 207.26 TaxID=1314779 RepID=A0A6A6DR92_9PEZI|nr:hypothetical protein K469DRAFT_266795 [Zopfia rhizophila CBS 207.26]